MFSLTAHDIPTLLLENQGMNGFYFLTIPSHEIRKYRISMESVTGGVSTSRYYDFRVDTTHLATQIENWGTGSLDTAVMMGIQFNRSLFRNYDIEPEPILTPIVLNADKTLAQIQLDSVGPNTFNGETFKLILLEPYLSSVNLIEIDRDYYLGPDMIVRFVYWRVIGGQIVFTGSFGDPLLDTDAQLESLRSSILPTDIIKTINTPASPPSMMNRRYYIFRVTNTPNIIFSQIVPGSTEVNSVSNVYTHEGMRYRMTLPGYIYTRVAFTVYLSLLDEDDNVIDPPSAVRVVSMTGDPITILGVNVIAATKTVEITMKTSSLIDELNLYVYAA